MLARVLGDWDGGRVEREVSRKRKEYAPYLTQWGEVTQLEHPEYWQGRNEMDQFTPAPGTGLVSAPACVGPNRLY